ncbi:hypothetical protein [Marivivens aquimaris]|uniref:hypothetical protein n=1 Tax=Marivivens aquimaris TaxID=2774876 RepID=UPI00187F9E04|nr:hypothetical protein [Marivivens aquimaris]
MWRSSEVDREPFVLPSGRTASIKYTFVVSPNRPGLGCHGLFRPDDGIVLWQNGTEEPCLLFGGSSKALDDLREHAALLPCGPARKKAHEAYLKARKYLWGEMVGRTVSVEGGGNAQNNIWVVGIEESSTVEFEIMLARGQVG